MYKLHIFNPEHDIALGKDDDSFSLPKAAVVTRKAFAHIPLFWADEGDWILVDNIDTTEERLKAEGIKHNHIRLVCLNDLKYLTKENMPSEVVPWGWDSHIVRTLLKANPLFEGMIPDKNKLLTIRSLSSRAFVATNILKDLIDTDSRLIGEMTVFDGKAEELNTFIKAREASVLKSPWSCSGRGVRFVKSQLTDNELGWCRNILNEQKAIIVEPYYNKVVDFALEFMANRNRSVSCLGMNLFNTEKGFFTNNVIDTADNKRNYIGKFIPISLLDNVTNKIIDITSVLFKGKYDGPFGIDMMIVKTGDGFKLHPCVEMNLRFTMGHVALMQTGAVNRVVNVR